MPIDRLTNVAEELTTELHSLRAEVANVDRRRKRSITSLWIVLLAFLLILCANIYVGYQNNKLLHLVKDATNPSGQVYQRGQKATGDAIKQLICDNHALHGDPHPTGLNCP